MTGFLTGLSLIVVIGAQNAFVLRQGLRREHVGVVVALCTASDAVLIALGVAGLGALVQAAPVALAVARWGGAAFLVVLAVGAFRRARTAEHLDPAATGPGRLGAVVATTLALTWLNPHVYLDTVVLLGGISTQHEPRWAFGVGAALGSLVWFSLLGFGARVLRPLFARPGSWRVLDVAVGVVMVVVAVSLVLG
ncbi:LysE/ArgO family amino acid transporter [Actinotalea sp. M2MS4P-6]|uniref:LysE/ArgO family amino acid transporter n=1 Tax=Actinotalea sp. M2MS4P-6 TaxID=2983762 RepID=UPI00398C5B2A